MLLALQLWLPGDAMPTDLVEEILACLPEVQVETTASPAAEAASPAETALPAGATGAASPERICAISSHSCDGG